MIDSRGLSKHYGDLAAVDDVSFSIGKGEVVGFLGPNGAGKTTTMRMITGFLPPTNGTAVVAGHGAGPCTHLNDRTPPRGCAPWRGPRVEGGG